MELQASVDAIEKQFAAAHRTHFRILGGRIPEGETRSRTTGTREMYRCDTFLKTLRYSIARFIETDQFPDADQYSIHLEDYDHPKGIPIVTLLAAMQQRGLRFANAARASEVARGFIFERMRDYYVDLYSMYAALEQNEKNLQDVNALIDQSHTVNALQMVWITGW